MCRCNRVQRASQQHRQREATRAYSCGWVSGSTVCGQWSAVRTWPPQAMQHVPRTFHPGEVLSEAPQISRCSRTLSNLNARICLKFGLRHGYAMRSLFRFARRCLSCPVLRWSFGASNKVLFHSSHVFRCVQNQHRWIGTPSHPVRGEDGLYRGGGFEGRIKKGSMHGSRGMKICGIYL